MTNNGDKLSRLVNNCFQFYHVLRTPTMLQHDSLSY